MKCYTYIIPFDAPEGRLLPLTRRMLPELQDSAIRAASLSFSLDGKWRYLNDKTFTIEPLF